MVKLGYTGSTLEITELGEVRFGGAKKVSVHRRKTGGKTYESPKIVLDRHYKQFIGKKYKVYRGKAVFASEGYGSVGPWDMDGDCIVLFFPHKWNEKKEEQDLSTVIT